MKTKTKINGLEVTNLTKGRPGGGLPKFVREATATRGYGDATQPLSLFVKREDVDEAFACAAQGNGSACVMAQAGKRIGAMAVYFYRTTAWVDFGEGPIVRFKTSEAIYRNVIVPFDEGDRESVQPGIYHLTPPRTSSRLGVDRSGGPRGAANRSHNSRGVRTNASVVQAHTERVVMASRIPARLDRRGSVPKSA